MDSAEALDQIAREVAVCELCPLAKSRTNAVPGEGPANAQLMFVGEGPGRDEDIQGRPFVGRAGQLLTQALVEAGFRRDEVFITNVVKCRPPGNRTPTPEEQVTCATAHLSRQVQAINPLLICLLGNTAVQALLGVRSLTAVRGKLLERNGRYYFATFHPAAILYDPTLREKFFGDISRLKTVLGEVQAGRKERTWKLEEFLPH